MKRNFFNHPVILLTFALSTFILSCSKEKIATAPPADEVTTNVTAQRTGKWGSITGMILPLKSEVKIAVYNRFFSSTDFYYTKNGSFRIDQIPAGIYTLIIIDITTSLQYTIPDIKVGAGTVIDIGVIKLQ